MLECYKCLSLSKPLMVEAVSLIFGTLQMAYKNDVPEITTGEMEETIFSRSCDMARKLFPQNRDAMEVYIQFLSANVGIISASEQPSVSNLVQSAKHQASILGEVLEEQVDILLKPRHEAGFVLPPNKVELFNFQHRLNLIKSELFILEVHHWKACLTLFATNRAATIREAFKLLIEFFGSEAVHREDEEKLILGLTESVLRETGSLCELSEDKILESSLCIFKLYKAEAFAGFETIHKITLFFRQLFRLNDANVTTACENPGHSNQIGIEFEEIESIYMRDLRCLFMNFPRRDGFVVAEHLLGNLKMLVSNLPDTTAFMEDQLQLLLRELEFFVLFLKDGSSQGQEFRVTLFMHAAEYIIERFMFGGGPLCYHQLVLFIAIQEAESMKQQIQNHFPDQESSELPLRDTHLGSEPEPETSEGSEQENTEAAIDVFGDQVQSIAAQLKTGKPLQVVSLVGMAGIGKTTLAKKVYGSQAITQHFDVRAFCCISQVYQKREVLLDILGGFVEVTDDMKNKDANGLEEEVKKNLSGKRYLIIVDDIWSAQHFSDLKLSFPNNNKGSKILVTTREAKLAEKLNKRGVHQVPLLETPDSWKLLQAMVFEEEKCPKELVEVGWLIAQNCRGLPLAIAVVSGILKKKDRVRDQWEEIAKHLKSFMAEDKASHFMDILEFSYNHLPSYLKPCYLYLASFLEDQEIPVKKLYWLWISEGFIPRSSEETAEGYLLELMNRSLVMEAKRNSMGGTKTCRIHDMLRDLCLKKAKEDNFMQLISLNDSDACIGVQYRVCVHSTKKNFTLSRASPPHVHSLLFFATNSTEDNESYDISCIYEHLKLLRVLDLESIASWIQNQTLEIDWMLRLNYLAIKGNIKHVPSSIANLWNLETLIVKGIRGEVKLPSSMWSMVTLRNVHIRPRASVTLESPDQLENSVVLKNLTTFSRPAFSSEQQAEEILKRWIHLKKLRCMFQEGTMLAALRLLIRLESLNLYYIGKQVPYQFSFPANLKKLTLSKFSWAWKHMDTISELLNLEVLKLLFRSFVGDAWDMEEGEFPKLKFFKLENLNLAEWTASSYNFPRLERLVLRNCKKLVKIPSEFESIYTLEMVEVHWCSQSCANSVQPIFQKLVKSGNKNFGVMITPQEWDFRASS